MINILKFVKLAVNQYQQYNKNINVINSVKIPLKIQNITTKNYKFVKSNVMESQIVYNVRVNAIMTIVIYTIMFTIQNVKMIVMII